MNKTRLINLRVSDEDYARYRLLADARKKSLSEIIRETLDRMAARVEKERVAE